MKIANSVEDLTDGFWFSKISETILLIHSGGEKGWFLYKKNEILSWPLTAAKVSGYFPLYRLNIDWASLHSSAAQAVEAALAQDKGDQKGQGFEHLQLLL